MEYVAVGTSLLPLEYVCMYVCKNARKVGGSYATVARFSETPMPSSGPTCDDIQCAKEKRLQPRLEHEQGSVFRTSRMGVHTKLSDAFRNGAHGRMSSARRSINPGFSFIVEDSTYLCRSPFPPSPKKEPFTPRQCGQPPLRQ